MIVPKLEFFQPDPSLLVSVQDIVSINRDREYVINQRNLLSRKLLQTVQEVYQKAQVAPDDILTHPNVEQETKTKIEKLGHDLKKLSEIEQKLNKEIEQIRAALNQNKPWWFFLKSRARYNEALKLLKLSYDMIQHLELKQCNGTRQHLAPLWQGISWEHFPACFPKTLQQSFLFQQLFRQPPLHFQADGVTDSPGDIWFNGFNRQGYAISLPQSAPHTLPQYPLLKNAMLLLGPNTCGIINPDTNTVTLDPCSITIAPNGTTDPKEILYIYQIFQDADQQWQIAIKATQGTTAFQIPMKDFDKLFQQNSTPQPIQSLTQTGFWSYVLQVWNDQMTSLSRWFIPL